MVDRGERVINLDCIGHQKISTIRRHLWKLEDSKRNKKSEKTAGMIFPRVAAAPKSLPERVSSRRFLTTSLTTFVVTGVFQQ